MELLLSCKGCGPGPLCSRLSVSQQSPRAVGSIASLQNARVEVSIPVPENVNLFGNRVVAGWNQLS